MGKSSSSNPQSAQNQQGSAESGSIGIGGGNNNSKINVSIQSSDPATVQAAISGVSTVANNALLANNAATVNALTASAEASHGVVQIAGESLDAVSAANSQAQQFVNQNTALAFDTIDKLITGSTNALAYESSQANSASSGATNGPPTNTNVYVGPASDSPSATSATSATSADHTATYLTIAVAGITLWYFFRTGRV